MSRDDVLLHWLTQACGLPAQPLLCASSDASTRRYFRVNGADGSRIVMDAPPASENVQAFVQVDQLLRAAGLHAPRIDAADLELGFLLLEDLGTRTYQTALSDRPADPLYRAALAVLCRLQQIDARGQVPEFDAAFMRREVELLPVWYLDRHLGIPLDAAARATWERCTTLLIDACLAQGRVLMHRDYHSRNLMDCADGPGMLDFQDAVWGPVSYDVASLLRDAYVEFDEDQQLDWLARWWAEARRAGLPVAADFGTQYRDFEWIGLQRQLKILGLFARLHHRDGKSAYLAHLPRVLAQVQKTCERYDELRPLSRLLAAAHGTLDRGLSF
ncbi:MAG: phosphotransferase [Pseudomonadota bacterium]|nr:phosphotransferase [Pseudomonadota bacterium]